MVSHAQARALDPNYNADESSYAWRITYDHLESKYVHIFGPHNATEDQLNILGARGKYADKLIRFRIYDDDGELYFSGYFLGDSESEDGFGPLDDFGAPDSGATEIRYLRGDVWETL
jgi:hypothetical protein